MSKHKLLLADDSITIQKVVNLTFADEGIEVISVSDGDSALEKIQQAAPDLVLADVNMPGMNGYQICERLKQNAATRTIPVILLVGSFEPFDEAEAYRVGADDYLTKPFQSIRQLVSKVSDLLESAENSRKKSAENIAPRAETVREESDVSFAETERFDRVEIGAFHLGDAGMDDEMIQTNQIGSLPTDEEQKFVPNKSSGSFDEISAYQSNSSSFNTVNDLSLIEETEKSAPAGQPAQANSFFDPREFNPKIYDFADETAETNYKTAEIQKEDYSAVESPITFQQTSDDKNYSAQNSTNEESFAINYQTSSVMEFDDLDLLEVPPLAPKAPNESGEDFDSPIDDNFIDDPERIEESELATTEIDESELPSRENKPPESHLQLPPETIEVIAQKVAERISDKAIREIAMELIPQLTEAIVKKMTKENTKK